MAAVSIVYRIVHILICLYVLTLAVVGTYQAFAYDLPLNFAVKRCAAVVLAAIVLFQGLANTELLLRLWNVALVACVLATCVFLRYQVLPYEYVAPELRSDAALRKRLEAFSATNRIGIGRTVEEGFWRKRHFYKTTGDAELLPIMFSVGVPIGLMFFNLALRRTDVQRDQD